MDVYIINDINEFHKYFPVLKSFARTGSKPDTFLIGFDVEFICEANQYESFINADKWVLNKNSKQIACIIQIATNSVCMVINLVKIGKTLPNNLIKLIKNSCWIKGGIGVDNDLSVLSQNYNLGQCEGGIELKNIGLLAGLSSPNLEFMYNTLIGDTHKKGSSICDWSKELNEEQLTYAAQDAIMSFHLTSIILEPSIKTIKNTMSEKNLNSKLTINMINMENANNNLEKDTHYVNYIGKLNEYAQKKSLSLPSYIELKRSLDNNYPFKIECKFKDINTYGYGNSKKEAKHRSAELLWEKIKN